MKEAIVTKGVMQKKLRIMGRGRTGIGRTIKSHVTIKVEKIDFAKMIEDAKTMNQKKVWAKRQKMVDNIKLAQIGGLETK